jgi:hypothetical protein
MNSVVTPIGASSLYIRILTYMVISYFPLALLDIRLPLPGLVVRLSDIYLIFLAGLFFLSGVEEQRWMVMYSAFYSGGALYRSTCVGDGQYARAL